MIHRMRCALVLVVFFAVIRIAYGQTYGEVVFRTDFDRSNDVTRWTGAGKLEKSLTKGSTLAVESGLSQISFPCEKYRGNLLLVSAMVKGEYVSAGPHSVKFQAAVNSPTANENFQAAIPGGTFDWRQTAVRVFVPWDATQITLTVGLDTGMEGKVWFDDIKVTVRHVDAFPKGKVAMKPWKFSRLRGTMVDPRGLTEDSLKVLGGEWKANLVRWQFLGAPPINKPADLVAYDQWLDGEIKRLDTMLPILQKYGLYTVVDLHPAPGYTHWDGGGFFTQSACQQKSIEVWKKLAAHYKNVPGIFGYDLINEPIDIHLLENNGYDTVPGDLYNWWELGDKISHAIRQIDPDTLIIFEPSPGAVTYGFRNLKPFNIPNVIYSLHMYMPYQFTHQEVLPCFPEKLRYPGFKWNGEIWDKARVQKELRQVIDFQKKYDARIYVGEFSATRWAPDHSAYRYLKDILEVFESNNWDWTYHAFRENECWSVELNGDKLNPKQEMTDRQKLLRELFEKNEKTATGNFVAK